MLTTAEICEKYGFKAQSVDYWRKQGHVKTVYDEKNRKYLFDEESVEAYVQSRQEAKKVAAEKRKKTPGIVCHICGEDSYLGSYKSFVRNHLVPKHDMRAKEYYDKYLVKEGERYCQYCGREMWFKSITKGYADYCGDMDCRMNNYDILDKIKKVKEERYGDAGYTNPEKRKQTCLERYGDESYTNREKAVKTTIERYGTSNLMTVDKFKEKCIETKYEKKLNYYKSVVSDCEVVSLSDKTLTVYCPECKSESSIHTSLAYSRIKQGISLCTNCFPICDMKIISHHETEVYNFIKSMIPEKEIIRNDRNTIGKELDILIPDKKIAIEYNGLFWHSSDKKEKDYHLLKTESCLNKGISLFHIYEDDWLHRTDIVKSIICDKLGVIRNEIYPDKYIIKENNSRKQQKQFYESNHIQGFHENDISLAAYLGNDIVAMMSFKKTSKENVYELIRYSTEINFFIEGVYENLFSDFVSKVKPIKIIHKLDKSWDTSDVCKRLGFEYYESKPPYCFYISLEDKIRKKKTKDTNTLKLYDSGRDIFVYKV